MLAIVQKNVDQPANTGRVRRYTMRGMDVAVSAYVLPVIGFPRARCFEPWHAIF